MNSAMYSGHVYHARRIPRKHVFKNRVCYLFLDLDELSEVFRGRWLWSIGRWNLSCFRRKDYLGDSQQPLKASVQDCVEQKLSFRPEGAVRVLTQLRTWGYLFNPVSFYYCYDGEGKLQAIISEITNTPWGERHRYVLDARDGTGEESHDFEFDKEFHISPFFPMSQRYEWRFTEPGETLQIHMANREQQDVVFQAGLTATRRSIGAKSLAKSLVAYPFQTYLVPLGIYWHAARLWTKKVPFHTHPKKRDASLPNP